MKPFDLERAKAGDKVVTRNGRKARVLCFDLQRSHPLVVAVEEYDGSETVHVAKDNGLFDAHQESKHDLFMSPVKKWVILGMCGGDAWLCKNGQTNIFDEHEAKSRISHIAGDIPGIEYQLVEVEL